MIGRAGPLWSTPSVSSDVTTLGSSSWRSPALPSGRLPPLGCSGWDASLPPPLWSSYQRVSGQDGCCKPGKEKYPLFRCSFVWRLRRIYSSRVSLSCALMNMCGFFVANRFNALTQSPPPPPPRCLAVGIWMHAFVYYMHSCKGSARNRADFPPVMLQSVWWRGPVPRMCGMSRGCSSNDIWQKGEGEDVGNYLQRSRANWFRLFAYQLGRLLLR